MTKSGIVIDPREPGQLVLVEEGRRRDRKLFDRTADRKPLDSRKLEVANVS